MAFFLFLSFVLVQVVKVQIQMVVIFKAVEALVALVTSIITLLRLEILTQ
jgi:hypothetical protein